MRLRVSRRIGAGPCAGCARGAARGGRRARPQGGGPRAARQAPRQQRGILGHLGRRRQAAPPLGWRLLPHATCRSRVIPWLLDGCTGTLRKLAKQHATKETSAPWPTQSRRLHTARRDARTCRSATALAPRGTLAPRPRRELRGPLRLRHDRPEQWSRGDARHASGPRAAHSPTSAQPPTKHGQASGPPLPPALARGSTAARHGAGGWRAAAQLAPLEAARRTKSESKNSECPSHAACSSSRRGRGSAAAAAASASAAAASARGAGGSMQTPRSGAAPQRSGAGGTGASGPSAGAGTLPGASSEGRGQHGRVGRKGDGAAVDAHVLLGREGHAADGQLARALALLRADAMLRCYFPVGCSPWQPKLRPESVPSHVHEQLLTTL